MRIEDLMRLVEERLVNRFFGKYAGVVTKNDDPLQIGRLRVKVPAVLGEDVDSGWALPAAPYGGGKDRGMLFIPEQGDTVWVEFLEGDPNRPIWQGTFWGAPESSGGPDDLAQGTGTEVPTSEGNPAGPGKHMIRTKAGHRVVFDDDGGLLIIAEGGDKAEIRLNQQGEVIIKAKKIKLGDSADQALILGDKFKDFFNQHTHPTGVGPSGTPVQPMMPDKLSTKVFTE